MSKRRPPSRTAKKPAPRTFPVMPLAIGLVVVLGIVAVVFSRGGDGGGDDSADRDRGGEDRGTSGGGETAPVEITGTPLADFAAGNDPAVGARAPVIRGATFAGSPITVGAAGEPQLIFFLAHWCPHCQKEVPVITDWIEAKGAPEGVVLRGVSTGVNPDAPNYPPSRWLEREDWPVDTLADSADAEAAAAYGLTGYPFFVALDGEGKVVARASGELTVDQIEALVDAARS